MRRKCRLAERDEQHLVHGHPKPVGDPKQRRQRRVQRTVLQRTIAAHKLIARNREHEGGQPFQVADRPALRGLREAPEEGRPNPVQRRHHLSPVRAHALERGHVHGTIDLVAGAGIDAGQPFGRHIEPQRPRKDIGFADLAAVGIHRDMRDAENRDDELEIAQFDRPARQLPRDRLAFPPGPRRGARSRRQRRGPRAAVRGGFRSRVLVRSLQDALRDQLREQLLDLGPCVARSPGRRRPGAKLRLLRQGLPKPEQLRLVEGNFLAAIGEVQFRRARAIGGVLDYHALVHRQHQQVIGADSISADDIQRHARRCKGARPGFACGLFGERIHRATRTPPPRAPRSGLRGGSPGHRAVTYLLPGSGGLFLGRSKNFQRNKTAGSGI